MVWSFVTDHPKSVFVCRCGKEVRRSCRFLASFLGLAQALVPARATNNRAHIDCTNVTLAIGVDALCEAACQLFLTVVVRRRRHRVCQGGLRARLVQAWAPSSVQGWPPQKAHLYLNMKPVTYLNISGNIDSISKSYVRDAPASSQLLTVYYRVQPAANKRSPRLMRCARTGSLLHALQALWMRTHNTLPSTHKRNKSATALTRR